MAERETLEVDVLIVGGGPAGMSAALRLAQLQKEKGGEPGSAQSLVTLELFDVQANVAIPEPTFQFSPAGRTFIDVTERWLR